MNFEEENVTPTTKKEKKTWKQELLEWIYCLGIAVLVATLLITFVGQIVDVNGISMEPTLHHQNKLVLYKLGYTPKKGDVIVFDPKGDNKAYIKRVIATPGDSVDIKVDETGEFYDVYVNDEKLEESYIAEKIHISRLGTFEGPQVVPDDHVFVLGDNRNNSDDSRDTIRVGMVEYGSIKGKAIFRIWPFNQLGPIH